MLARFEAERGPSRETPARTAPLLREGARALVIDDEDGIRRLVCEVLRRAGFHPTPAHDGAAALEILREGQVVDVVLLDVTMPGLSGAETLAAIREIAPSVPVVLTSGFTEQEAVSRLDVTAANGFIQKPFRPAALVQVMQAALGRAQESSD